MMENVQDIVQEAIAEIAACSDEQALDAVRVNYLGRKGRLTFVMRAIGEYPPEERPAKGKAALAAKASVTRAREERLARIKARTDEKPNGVDVTLPGLRYEVGRRHPLTVVTEEIVEIFAGMGFSVARGPEVELEYYNFDALNTPADHPARDEHDTFYLDNGALLRTHTSPVQIRTMECTSPPVRVISPGRCYRNDTPDATHFPVFHQVEGLYVDRGVSFADLKGVISCFARQMFGPDVRVRFRPDFFPFTEPSAEYAFSCVACGGTGCRVCKNTGWLEIAGSGMVDPEVFRHVGYDSEVFSGYAFGMGVERIAMLKYGINDIRLFYENDLRFIRQF
ncbi:MAG: phenylalanine--tRNA ligase subunit alpha [Candidatus Latescibacterota bacterium]